MIRLPPGEPSVATRSPFSWKTSVGVIELRGQALPLQPLGAAERGTLEAGGLIPYLKARLGRTAATPPTKGTPA